MLIQFISVLNIISDDQKYERDTFSILLNLFLTEIKAVSWLLVPVDEIEPENLCLLAIDAKPFIFYI